MTMTIMETQEIEAIKYQQKVVDMVMALVVRECSTCRMYRTARCPEWKENRRHANPHDECWLWKRRNHERAFRLSDNQENGIAGIK